MAHNSNTPQATGHAAAKLEVPQDGLSTGRETAKGTAPEAETTPGTNPETAPGGALDKVTASPANLDQVTPDVPEQEPGLRTAAIKIRKGHDEITNGAHVVPVVTEVGKTLLAVQDILRASGCKGEGFKKWVQDNCGFSPATAYHYMYLYKRSLKKPELLTLGLTEAYQEIGILKRGPKYVRASSTRKKTTEQGQAAAPAPRQFKPVIKAVTLLSDRGGQETTREMANLLTATQVRAAISFLQSLERLLGGEAAMPSEVAQGSDEQLSQVA